MSKKYFAKLLEGKLVLCENTFKEMEQDMWNNGGKSEIEPFKVIGEISPYALSYVKEGQELNEEDIQFTVYEPYEPAWSVSLEEWLEFSCKKNIQIKGPCSHFH